MIFPIKTVAVSSVMLMFTVPALATELYIYPAGGQSAEQMDKDKYECYNWARKDSGFDPMAVPTATSAPPEGQKKSGGVAKGGLAGAATGAIIGDNRTAARRGAVTGGLIGGVRQSSQNAKVEQSQQQHAQQEASHQANERNNYNRAYSACLEGRGYTVR